MRTGQMRDSLLKRWRWLGVPLALLLAMFAPGVAPALAHGGGISVEPPQAKHGETITVSGRGFEPDTAMAMSLEGTQGAVPLGQAKTGPDGILTVQFTIPEAAGPGAYRLKAVWDDGSTSVDFAVMAEGAQAPAHSEGTQVVFRRSGGETLAIAVIAVALAAAGAVLVLAGRERGART